MSVGGVNITNAIANARLALEQDSSSSPGLRASTELLLVVIELLMNKLGINSSNSSKPPSQDPNRTRGRKNGNDSKNKQGGQKGHTGKTLNLVNDADEIVDLSIDRRTLPVGIYHEEKPEIRQVFDIVISKVVTEFRAQVLINSQTGDRFVAEFPEEVGSKTQYGSGVRTAACYFSQWQLLPYERLSDFFTSYAGMPISQGTLVNINQEAFRKLERFERIAKDFLVKSGVMNADETGINICGKNHWLHTCSTDKVVLFSIHKKRGKEATEEIGILPKFSGTLVHDCWATYFSYENCTHALCLAHIIRELERAHEQDKLNWAKKLMDLLLEINKILRASTDPITTEDILDIESRYDKILEKGAKETPPPIEDIDKKRGRQKKSKARNLLERLQLHKDAALRSINDRNVPFTNNRAENDIRMAKVQQKISGCFRSVIGAKRFCRIRSYLLTCQLNGVGPSEALDLLFRGQMPSFMEKLLITPE